jgi:lipid A disaccharide synthetase
VTPLGTSMKSWPDHLPLGDQKRFLAQFRRSVKENPTALRYDQVNAMLLNEFLKEHCKVEQLTKDFESKLAEQQKQIEALTAGLQKVTAQLEASKPAPQVVNNP